MREDNHSIRFLKTPYVFSKKVTYLGVRLFPRSRRKARGGKRGSTCFQGSTGTQRANGALSIGFFGCTSVWMINTKQGAKQRPAMSTTRRRVNHVASPAGRAGTCAVREACARGILRDG